MTRLKFPEIVVMVLALLGGLGFLFLIGIGLMRMALRRATAETGGVAFAVSGGLSTKLFLVILIVALAAMVALAVFLWRR
jgi:hypothetical protein